MKKRILFAAIYMAILLAFPTLETQAQSQEPVVNAVLFYSPTCGHCEFVITQTILPMTEEYGPQLQVIGVDVTTEGGNALFINALQTYQVEQAGVPFLVIENIYLIGSTDIPEQFPALVESYLEQGGVGLPAIPGLAKALSSTPDDVAQTPSANDATTVQTPSTLAAVPTLQVEIGPSLNWKERFAQDRFGNTLSVLVLTGMLISLAIVLNTFKNKKSPSHKKQPAWLILILCLLGFGIAGYLTFVETTQTSAICGPVGDCNTVQQSEYARLFGVLPVGVLGLFGYIAIFIFWLLTHYGNKQIAKFSALAMFALAFLGTLLSIYLTFLEPFVIGATCIWCLTSAVLMTAIMHGTSQTTRQFIYQN